MSDYFGLDSGFYQFSDLPWIVFRRIWGNDVNHVFRDPNRRIENRVIYDCTVGPSEFKIGFFPWRHWIHGVTCPRVNGVIIPDYVSLRALRGGDDE